MSQEESKISAGHISRTTIIKAYEILEKLPSRARLGKSFRVRCGNVVRLEYFVENKGNTFTDISELDNNEALIFLVKEGLGAQLKMDNDYANYFTSPEFLIEELEYTFGSHFTLKLETLRDITK